MGKCNSCGSWNTFQEEIINKPTATEVKRSAWLSKSSTNEKNQPVLISKVQTGQHKRILTADPELNRVLGGGIVRGALMLIGGQPGIGKSTLMLQVALHMPKAKILYVSGEESEEQIKMRAERITQLDSQCYILNETNINEILKQIQKVEPEFVVIDSIQTLSSPHIDSMPGSISQVRECAGELQRFAKMSNVPIFIIGHITKDGTIAGPKLLEHIVDVVLQFEGDQHYVYRILRTLKNRFGSTDEMGIYEMRAIGLREVVNPSELLISQKEEDLSGSAIGATLEGMRPFLIETQALVSTAVYGTPQRSATGFDLRRLSMLLAVLEKRGGLPFAQNDVFLNIAGGIKVDDPAIDLSIVSALISSLEDVSIPGDICFSGEVGLSGEIRAVSKIEQRIQEADKLGFSQIFISKYNAKGLKADKYNIDIQTVSKIEELYKKLFE